MAKHVMSFADKKLAMQITDPEVLIPRVPRLEAYYEGLQEYSTMLQEIGILGKLTRKAGFTTGQGMQRIANIPTAVRAALLEIDPDIFTNKTKFYAWLDSESGQPYDLRGKIVL